MLTLKLQLDYVLTRNILVSDICKCRAFRDVTFNADHSPVLLIFIVAQEELKSFTLTKLHTVGLKDEECRTKFRQRMPIHVGVRTRRKVCDADSSAKCIQDDRGKHFQFRCCGRELLSDFNQKSACKELAVQQGRSWTDICGQRGTTNRVVGSGQYPKDEKWKIWPKICHNEELYTEIDVIYLRMTKRYQHLAPPSKVATENRLCFIGHILRRLVDPPVQRVLRSLLASSWETHPGRKRKFWTEMVNEDQRTLGVDTQFTWNVSQDMQ
ncbi:hypothetical protein RB195_013460 [Necator americanus]|uniref:Uncharacterized protein n=1 Tax=Necator americanus TaxID=51031 RepID=A0ABR1DWR7_NECAM